ncbi:Shedu anti-phage system protein SduA domain-containing protein [Streptomyces sp. NPDC059556]|uniref:Shedu anti-phage system protein SduA domain-containing protein n=1 Tax=Streptomyces sp. NPDC059556 TaxID=3346863 RepID=UPI00369F0F10
MTCWLLMADDKGSSYELARESEGADEGWHAAPSVVTDLDVQPGDPVLLWRRGRSGGVVALGEVVRTAASGEPDVFGWLSGRRQEERGEERRPPHVRVTTRFSRLVLSSPVPGRSLRAAGLSHVARQARATTWRRGLVRLDLTDAQWERVVELVDESVPPNDTPTAWHVPPGAVVDRAELHQLYGGPLRLRVGPSGRTPNAFLFLDHAEAGEPAPRQDGSVLLAPGQAQGTERLSHENLVTLTHRRRGIPLRVFLARRAECLYLGEYAVAVDRPIEQWVDTGPREAGSSRSRRSRPVGTRTPLFRLLPVQGLELSDLGQEPFDGRARVRLRPVPADEQAAVAVVQELLALLRSEPETAASLGELDEAQLLAHLVQRARRQADLDRLRAAVENPDSTEGDLQKIVEGMTWIFGGEFLPGTARRSLTPRDQLDLVLLRPDGTLHGVELKKASVPSLVTRHRNHLIAGREVDKAKGQALNYLCELDEKRAQILVDLKIDPRRASMTVVIGNRGFATAGASPEEIDEVFRILNAHLNRVDITTYDRLIENAQRMIDLSVSDG